MHQKKMDLNVWKVGLKMCLGFLYKLKKRDSEGEGGIVAIRKRWPIKVRSFGPGLKWGCQAREEEDGKST